MQLTTLFLKAEDFMLPCLNKKLFGMECMGCGLQRSVALLLKGEFAEAFFMYPAIYPIVSLLGFLVVKSFVKVKWENRIMFILVLLVIITVVGNFIYKQTN